MQTGNAMLPSMQNEAYFQNWLGTFLWLDFPPTPSPPFIMQFEIFPSPLFLIIPDIPFQMLARLLLSSFALFPLFSTGSYKNHGLNTAVENLVFNRLLLDLEREKLGG